jgi:hypothetical protein
VDCTACARIIASQNGVQYIDGLNCKANWLKLLLNVQYEVYLLYLYHLSTANLHTMNMISVQKKPIKRWCLKRCCIAEYILH